jgi:predicted nucleic acid-binding protein
MMRILIDTDVALDFLLVRQPFDQEANAIFLACSQQRCAGYIAPITAVNVFYIARKTQGTTGARQLVENLLKLIDVCPLNKAILQTAHALPLTDYEDAVQTAAALAAGLDAIVTRNGSDYQGAPITILTPADMLTRLTQTP